MVSHNTISEDKILRAARKVFTENGFAGARMQAIAREARVNKALLHYYFRSKEKLYQAVLRQILTQVWETIRREMGTSEKAQGMEEIIRTVVSAYIRTLKDNPDFPCIMLHEISSGGKNIPIVLSELLENFRDVFSRILAGAAQGTSEGRLKPMEPVQIIMNLIGMVIATFLAKPFAPAIYRRVFQKELVMDDAFYEERIRAVTETLCRGILIKEAP
jgi:AcrR family transcriptional regulator